MASLVSANEQKKVRSVCQEFALGNGKYFQGLISCPLYNAQECLFKLFAVFCVCYFIKRTSGFQISSSSEVFKFAELWRNLNIRGIF
jgi:hypothetical protein